MRFVLNNGKAIPESPSILCSFPSHGNVGQLAIDVVIATLAKKDLLEKIGYIETFLVAPMTGYDQFAPSWGKSLCMPIEGLSLALLVSLLKRNYIIAVYLVPLSSMLVIQQRAPCSQINTQVFADSFMKLIQSTSYKHLFALSGASTYGLPDDIITR